MFKRFSKNRYGYSRWDGAQRIEGLEADDMLDAFSDDSLEDGSLQQAVKRLMQEGIRTDDGRRTMGLRELMERMRNQRNQQLDRDNMASGVMDDLREKLEEIKQLEREGIQRRRDEGAQQSQQSSDQQQSPGQRQEQRQSQRGSGQEGQQGESGSQQGQSGESDEDLTPEHKQKMLQIIAKRNQDYLDNLAKDV